MAPASQQAVVGRPTIVVLPFENLGAGDDEYFADGMTDEITSRLASVNGLTVISRASAMQYREARPSLDRIGEELGVDYVLEGTVRWQRAASGPSEVRVTPQLSGVSEDTLLWTERYDAVLADIFEVQSDIAGQVIERLGVALLEPEFRFLGDRPTDNLEAYDYYLKGNEYLNRAREIESGVEARFAIQMYEEAFQLDQTFALAYANQSAAHSWLYDNHMDRSEGRLASARQSVEQALSLDPDLPEAHIALGAVLVAQGQATRGLEEYQIALASQPSSAEVYEAISHVESDLGLWEDSLASMSKAAELNPRLSRLACWTGGRLFGLGRFEEALSLHERAIALAPDRSCPYVCTTDILVNADASTDRARQFLEQLPPSIGLEDQRPINYSWVTIDMMDGRYQEALDRLASGSTDAYAFQAYYVPKDLLFAQLYGLLDQSDLERAHYEAARDLLEERVEEGPDDSRFHASLGIAYAGLGQREAAIREGQLALRILAGNQDEKLGFRLKDLAQIHVMLGDYDSAVDELERLLSIPAFFTAPYLKLDSTWHPLREHPRFQTLLPSS